MTSLRKRLANKANARQSTGPKTAAGRRTASLNATTHGLSVATDPNFLDPTAERVAGLIASDGIGHALARDLAAKIVDYERCMDHQRALLAQALTPPMTQEPREPRPQGPHGQMLGKQLDRLKSVIEEQALLSGRVLMADLNKQALMMSLMIKLVANVQATSDKSSQQQQQQVKRHQIGAVRHYKRSTSQLIKALKALGPG